jgi:hypothetical protein
MTATGKVFYTVEQIKCTACDGTGQYDGECGWCKGTGKKPRRMDGYYIGFDPTGSFAIDKILGAVACAGKAYHHTECWEDETRPYDDHTGNRPTEWIQNAAIAAVSHFDALLKAEREKALREAADKVADLYGEYSEGVPYCDRDEAVAVIKALISEDKTAGHGRRKGLGLVRRP